MRSWIDSVGAITRCDSRQGSALSRANSERRSIHTYPGGSSFNFLEMSMKTVSIPALTRRINRKLKRDCEVLRACPYESRWIQSLGRHYVIDVRANCVIHTHVDLEQWGRDVGALRDNETLV